MGNATTDVARIKRGRAVYGSKRTRDIAIAGRLPFPKKMARDHLRSRLNSAAMWFRISRHGRTLVPSVQTIKILNQIHQRAATLARHADVVIVRAKRQSDSTNGNAHAGQISTRTLERFQAARSSLNAILGSNNRSSPGLSILQDRRSDVADAGDVVEKRMELLESPVGHALGPSVNKLGPTSETPLDLMLERFADPDCAIDIIRNLSEELAARAKDGAERLARMRSNMIRPGNSGDYAMNGWIDEVLNIFEEFSGKRASITVSVKPETYGIPEGAALDFVMAAFQPIRTFIAKENARARKAKRKLLFDDNDESLGHDAWASRIRTAIKHRIMTDGKASTVTQAIQNTQCI